MDYKRHLDKAIERHFKKYRQVLILLGARQVGKTTLLQRVFPKAYYLLVDNESVRQNLERYDISVYKQIIPPRTAEIVIDEIHMLSDPGRAAKIIYDQIPQAKLIITGSSSLQIKNKTTESLAGRKIEYHLYPLTFSEILYQKGIEGNLNYRVLENIMHGHMKDKFHTFDTSGVLGNLLIYGFYPALLNHPGDRLYLHNFIDSVIFKDLLELRTLENRSKALNLLRLLAYQIGSLVNISELSSRLGLNSATVRNYLRIFEQSFVIFPLGPFSQRGRDEIGKMNKYYFYDTGIRNALIDDFHTVDSRYDYGALFENFLIAEILKINHYGDFGLKMNYWRTKQGSEIDLVLTGRQKTIGVEIKTGKGRANKAFLNRYPEAVVHTVSPANFY